MRMRGLEPPRDLSHTALNRARLPIPPHPPASSEHSDHDRAGARRAGSGAFVTLDVPEPPSSRGLGRRPLTAETGVRIPVAVPAKPPDARGFLRFWRRQSEPRA